MRWPEFIGVMMKKIKCVKYVLGYGILCILLGWLFYRSKWVSIFFAVIGTPFFVYRQSRFYEVGQRKILEEQFKDCILSLAASLRTGYSPENAWSEVHREMVLLHGEKSVIVREIENIRHKLMIKQPLETILAEFGERSGVEDIKNFADVFRIAKRGGGDLVSIISSTAKTISDKADVQREIQTIISAKKLEQKIMIVMPLVILVYMEVFNRGFLDVLYESAVGRVIMTGCFLMYMTAFFLGEKIVDIGV